MKERFRIVQGKYDDENGSYLTYESELFNDFNKAKKEFDLIKQDINFLNLKLNRNELLATYIDVFDEDDNYIETCYYCFYSPFKSKIIEER